MSILISCTENVRLDEIIHLYWSINGRGIDSNALNISTELIRSNRSTWSACNCAVISSLATVIKVIYLVTWSSIGSIEIIRENGGKGISIT